MSDGDGGIRPSTFFIYDPPGGGNVFPERPRSGQGPVRLAPRDVFHFALVHARAGPARRVRRSEAGQLLPTRSRRPPGRADGGPICVSCLCHVCVIFMS